jgi:hypothetical protein
VALRPHLSIGLPFRSRSLWLLSTFPKTQSRVADFHLVKSVTRLSLLLVERRTRGFAPPTLDGFAFSLAILDVCGSNMNRIINHFYILSDF